MICPEFKELVGAYALDAVDDLERAAMDAHLLEPSHEGCVQALERARAAAAQLSGAVDDTRVPGRVWERIEEGVGPVRKRSWAAPIGWAAAVALGIAVLFLVQERTRLRREARDLRRGAQSASSAASSSRDLARACAAELDAARAASARARDAIAFLERPGSRVVSLEAVGGALQSGFAVLDAEGLHALLVSTTLSPTAQHDYQLWVVPRGRRRAAPIPAGLIGAPGAGVAVADFDAQSLSSGAAALEVSSEPKGGSPTGKPTELVLQGKLPD